MLSAPDAHVAIGDNASEKIPPAILNTFAHTKFIFLFLLLPDNDERILHMP
jgi:hypothetical protein